MANQDTLRQVFASNNIVELDKDTFFKVLAQIDETWTGSELEVLFSGLPRTAQNFIRIEDLLKDIYELPSNDMDRVPLLTKTISQVDGSRRRLLLVSSNLPEFELLASSAQEKVTVVQVDYNKWQLQDLAVNIIRAAGLPAKQMASVGIIDHGTPGSFCLLKSVNGGSVNLPQIEHSPELQNFFKFLANYVEAPRELHKWRNDPFSRIDLMACSVAADAEGEKLIHFLEDITEVNWAASSDKTGNADLGGNWVMETEDSLNLGAIDACYFHPEMLQQWRATAGWGTWLGAAAGVGVVCATGGTAVLAGAVVGAVVGHVADGGNADVGGFGAKACFR